MACRNPYIDPLIRLAIETGMRQGELLRIRWADVDLVAGTLRIPITKNGQPRTIPLTPAAVQHLKTLSSPVAPPHDHVFRTTARALKLAWGRLTRRAGLDDLHFHDLRHEAVSRFFEKGLTVPEVALISGHRDPRMLFRYTHPRPEDIAAKLQDRGCENVQLSGGAAEDLTKAEQQLPPHNDRENHCPEVGRARQS